MEKEDLKILYDTESRSKSNVKRLDEHDRQLKELTNVYVALTKMDTKVANVETDVSEIKTDIKGLKSSASEPTKEKASKWDKLIDYLFYAILAYALIKLGLK